MITLEIQMMGRFALKANDRCLYGKSNRAHQAWALLSYLILERGRSVPTEELVAALWDGPQPNPQNSLKAVLHRVRTSLDSLWEGAGKELILWQDSGYSWNGDYPVQVDVEQFQSLCGQAEEAPSPARRVELEVEALALYQGGFLPPVEGPAWVAKRRAQCHEFYVSHLLLALPVLEKQGRWEEIAALCGEASQWEPSLLEPYRAHLTALIETGRSGEAVSLYERARDRLLTISGVLPSDEMDALYRRALHGMNARALPITALLTQLQEAPGDSGALLCDYGIFKALCHSMARGILRGGQASVALLTLSSEDGSELPRRSLECAMENLQEVIRMNLRQGDTLTRCGVSQFVMLLPQADPSGSKVVCGRIERAFRRQYPHSPAVLHTAMHPLEPRK